MRHLLLLVAAAISGAGLMAVEFSGQRILAIHWGDSVTVWGAAIAVVLGGLTAGYSLGGRLADRWPRRYLLAGTMATGAAVVLVVSLVGDDVAESLAGSISGLRTGALVGSIVLLLAPSVLLGMTSPIAARLAITDVERSGRRAGDVYASGNLGSIIGALAATFWLIEALGTLGLMAATAATVGVTAAVVAGRQALGGAAALIAVASLVASVSLHGSALGSVDGRIVEVRETEYSHMRVVENEGIMQLWLGATLHSAQSVAAPEAVVLAYTRALQRGMCVSDEPVRRAAVLGVGGGTMVGTIRRLAPDAQVDAVDVDPAVIDAAHRWFGPPTDGVRYVASDARRFLAEDGPSYDLVVLDAYSHDRLPAHLLTREFFAILRDRMAPGGVLAVNVAAAPSGDVAASAVRTVETAFSDVRVYDANPELPYGVPHNLVLLAGDQVDVDPGCLRVVERRLELGRGALDGGELDIPRSRGHVYEDAHPPVALIQG